MVRTHFLFLSDPSPELKKEIKSSDPIQCLATPPVYVVQPSMGSIPTSQLLPPEDHATLHELVAISCKFDTTTATTVPLADIDHYLEVVAIALQLVKPTRGFLEYSLEFDSQRGVTSMSTSTQSVALQLMHSNPYLRYQEHHTIMPDDVKRAISLLTRVSQAMELHQSSWTHSYGSIHRALVFFCQGYTVNLHDLKQLFWAAGLDCLFASKKDSRKRGARTISERLQRLWGADFRPYSADTVNIPIHQSRPDHHLIDIGEHIFWLRNAFIHGLTIKPSWLSPAGSLEQGYAYQLFECTEILLRLTLVRLFEDTGLFDVFLDPVELDKYFS